MRPSVQSGFWYQCINANGNVGALKSLPREIKPMDTDLDYSDFPASIAAALGRGGNAGVIAAGEGDGAGRHPFALGAVD